MPLESSSMADPSHTARAAPRSKWGVRLKRLALVCAMSVTSVNVWTGSPLLALWIGSKVQSGDSQTSMTAVFAIIVCLVVFSIALYQALKHTMHAYREATGTLPTVRTHAPWLRSMRGERPDYPGNTARISGAEKIVVVTVLIAATAFEIWFFFFSGSSIGGGGGR
jgi:hypothetical protein